MSYEPTAGAPPVDLGRSSRSGWRGRDREWRLLSSLLSQAADGGRGGVLLVEGGTGMGKSRLLGDATEAAAQRGFMLARGTADEPSRLAPLMPLVNALGESLDSLRSTPQAALSDVVDLRLWLLERLQIRLEERAARGPLLITLDDLQWADPTTLLALRALVPALASYPVVWLLARTTCGGSGGGGDVEQLYDVLERDGAVRIMLEALDDRAVTEVAVDVLGAPPEPGLLALVAAAGGNPFLLIELLEGLRDEGTVEIADGHARTVAQRLPQRSLRRVHEWLGLLDPRTRHLLQVAAVLGCSFRVDDLAELLGEPPSRLLPALEEAEAATILVPATDALAFRHNLLWQAVLDTVHVPVRQALHRQAAEMLLDRGGSAIPAAAHLMHYARPGDGHALAGLDRAAREVLASSPGTAAELAVRALDLTAAGDPDRFDRTVLAIYTLSTAGRLSEAAELARTALRQTTVPSRLGNLRKALAYVLLLAGRPAEAVAEAELALGLQDLPDELRDVLEHVWFLGLFSSHDYRRGRGRAEAVVATAEGRNRPSALSAHLLLTDTAWAEGRAADARDHTREAVRIASVGPIKAQHVHPLLHLATLLTDLRELDEAESVLHAADEEITALGHTAHAASPAFLRARLRLAAGRLDDANAEAQAALAITEEIGIRVFVLFGISVLIIVAVRRGDMDAAARYVAQYECEHQAGEGAVFGKGLAVWAAALTAEAQGDTERAMDLLTAAFTDPMERRWLLMVEPGAAAFLTRTALAVGDRSAAKTIAETAEHLARDNPEFPTLAASAAHADGILRHDACALARAAGGHIGPWDRASATEDLGSLLARNADTEAAVRHLDEALDRYQEIGALRDAARIRARLRELGVRRRHGTRAERPDSGWESLTHTEHEVAVLVAQGLTNPQVAARLFVSRHTVNFHLRQIFRKLGIASRVELARVASKHPAVSGS